MLKAFCYTWYIPDTHLTIEVSLFNELVEQGDGIDYGATYGYECVWVEVQVCAGGVSTSCGFYVFSVGARHGKLSGEITFQKRAAKPFHFNVPLDFFPLPTEVYFFQPYPLGWFEWREIAFDMVSSSMCLKTTRNSSLKHLLHWKGHMAMLPSANLGFRGHLT